MTSKPFITAQSPLTETLSSLTNDDLKPRAQFCIKNAPTRKSELIDVIVSALNTPETLQHLWSQLNDLSRQTVAAAIEHGGQLNEDAFRAQYHALPWDEQKKKKSVWSYRREYLPIDVFLYHGRIPPDVIPLLKPLVPQLTPYVVEARAELPAAEVDELYIAETEDAAVHDWMATLGFIAEGKAAVTPANERPTSAAVLKLSERLLHGEYLPGENEAPSPEPIRAYGWLMLAQAARCAKPVDSKLELTPKGRKALAAPGVEQLREVYHAWVENNQADELIRINALKGQKGKGARLTRPADRKGSIVEAVCRCPIGQWTEREDFLRAIRAWRLDFRIEQPDYHGLSKLYVGSSWEYGHLSGFGHEPAWRGAQAQYVLVCLWEYLATLGGLDLAYALPEDAQYRLSYLLDVSGEPYFSRYVGLRYFRVNALGAYLLGLTDEYAGPARVESRPVFMVLPNCEVAITQREEFTPNVRAILERVAEPVSEGVYRLQRERLLTALETGLTTEAVIEFLADKSAQPLPKTVLIFLDDIQRNSRALKASGTAVLFSVTDAALAQLITNDRSLTGLCTLTADTTLVVPADKEAIFRRRIKQLGFGIRH
ncbi:MAG: helicase-associated domain-containing protein [Thermoflexales bacterium]|nr:helicase-associated domain-containing protein [Thermoflexales bacterium]